jgi:L-alanine-DL-glutamate epimerase-like enolase superfamily enzyme
VEIEVWSVPTPLALPVLTPAGPYDTFFHLVVVVRDGSDEGWGYSGLATAAILDASVARAAELAAAGDGSLAALLTVEHRHGVGTDVASKAATNAIALAAWDLAGRTLGVACADLWGRRDGVDALDAYASGFFLDGSLDDLAREAASCRASGYRFVKMRVGLDVDTDLRRFDAVRTSFPDDGQVAVDAVTNWDHERARDFAARASAPLLWLEDPVPYDALGTLGAVGAPIAIGESVRELAELESLRREYAPDYALLDVQQLGGPLQWLAAANALASQGMRIGSHIYTAVSAHLLACVDRPLPVEVFDWSDALYDPPPVAGADGRLVVPAPGLGATLRRDTLARFGRQVSG